MLQEKAAAKACQQGACRLQNPCGGMEGKRHDAAQEYYIQAGSSQFADQKAQR